MKIRVTLLCWLLSIGLYAQLITPFTIRYQVTQKGGIRYVSNTSVSCTGGGCAAGRSEVPPGGTATDNGFTAAYVDIDADGSTFSSSSDSLALPLCSQISWAGLYWGGEITNAAPNYGTRAQCLLKVNNGSYSTITATSLQDNAVGFNTYHCYTDITAIVTAAGTNARFTVANVAARVGGTNRFGGWTIVVVYKNDLQPMRNLTVFNGLSNVSGGNPITDITVSGFLTPLAGPVTFEVGNLTYDGDRSSTGDQLMFNGGSGFVNISDAVNPTNDIFNSTLSYNGVQKTTPFINPGYTNSLGLDADIFIPNNAAKNYIGNSATSATLRLTTGGETFLTQVVTMAIDVYEPDLRAAVRAFDINGGSVMPGDTIEYTIVGKNIGSDPSVNTFIVDTLERNAVFVPGSLRVTVGPNSGIKSDALADDQGEYIAASRTIRVRIGTGANGTVGGQVNNSSNGADSTQIKFRCTATTDCILLLCDNIINARAYIYGTGNVSGNTWSNGSNPDIFDGFGCPIPGTTNTPIQSAICPAISATSNSPVCVGGTINLSLNSASSNATYLWSGPNGFSSTSASPSLSSATLAMAGTYTCVVTVTGYTCTSTVNTSVTVSPATTIANAGPDQTICTTVGSATMAGNAPAVGTGTWTQISGPATATITTPVSNSTTITNMTVAGTYVFQWSITGSCSSSSDQITVTVNAPPTASNAGPDASVCALTTALAGNVPTSGTGTWTLVAGPGTATFSNANTATSNVTVSVVGAYTFRWTIANAPCTASQDNVVITFVASPTTSNAGPDQTICTTVGSATMAGNVPTVGAGTWTQVSGPVTATITTPGSNATTITGMTTAGTYVFQWSIANAPCAASTDQITVTVNAPPTTSNAGSDQTICAASATMAGNTAAMGTGTWTQLSGPNTATITTPGSPTTTTTGLIAGTYVFQWTIANLPCSASSDQVTITVSASPTTSNAGPDQTICTTVGSATMAGNVPTVGAGTWTQVSGPVTATITTPGSDATTITGMTTAGTYVFQWSIANAPCTASTDQVQIIVNDPPTTSNAGSAASVCGLTATLAGNIPTVGTGTWTQTAGPGTSTFTNANLGTSNVTVTVAGTYTFTWTITNAPCAASVSTVNITFVNAPSAALAGADDTTCGLNSTLTGNIPASGTGTWTQLSGPGTTTFTNANLGNTGFSVSAQGVYVYVWTITNAPCPQTTDTVTITLDAQPSASNAGADQLNVCPPSVTMAATAPVFGTGTWTQISGPNTANIITPNSEVTSIDALIPGTYTFVWTITNGSCPATTDTVNVVVIGCDSDGDGINDFADLDDDNDGIPDTVETTADTDGDGIPNSLDLDSDNDGIPDVQEAGGSDTNNDGIIDGFIDLNGDGLDDNTAANPLPNPDTDGDGIVNAQDLDSDNDGITDVTEAGGTDANGDGILDGYVDTDGDGWNDVADANNGGTSLPTPDTDGDGHNDYVDLDSDNDGIPDVIEAGGTDTNGDGIIDGFTDTDGDGLSDNVDPDNGGTPLPNPDTDGDGVNDAIDLDSDNDGITDVTEAGGTDTNGDGIIDGYVDTDGDGLSDNVDTNNGGTALPNPDTDGDGVNDVLDLDSDNDGITDVTEAGGVDANGDGIIDGFTDTDGDGLSDNVDPNNGGTPLPTPDTDGDGHNDYVDLDSDNDGITDVTEAGGTDANGDGIIDGYTDTDGDGLSDNVDTNNGGTMLPNGDQDGDGIPNVLDLDSDNDGITDVTEAGGTDANGDGIIDGYADTDNDGLSDNVDPNNGGTPLPTPDTDGDGLDNYLDVDSDNDGITDVTEAGGTDANNDGIIDGYVDTDNDGLSDNVDTNNGGTMLAVGDFDNDGIENYLDLDSDNDGIVDVIEAGGVDGDNDGIIGTGPVVDTDGDGLSDVVDTDNGGTALPVPNTDASGGADYLDIDADNDGIVDNIEGQPTASYVAPTGVDTDGDGIDDAYDTIVGFGGAGVTPTNTDGADTPDYIDLDSDNDTAPDTTEGWDTNNDGVADTLPSGNDSDNDGLDDAYDADGTSTTNAGGSNNGGDLPTDFPDLDNVGGDRDWRDPLDTDGDGISNVTDLDDDNDGIPDTLEASGDTDGDGIPDSLDLDSDNDGIPDVTEAGGTDTNGDGIIDGFTDTDGDGLSDNVDPDNGGTPLPNPDTDGDGVNDAIDLDSDNDGITDVTEAGGTDTNGDGIIDGYVDTDGDGLSDNVDTNNGGTALPNPDTDGDGVNDVLDLDSDNDGITDVTEAGGVDANGDGIIDGYVDTDNDGLSDNVDTNNGGTALPTPDTDGDGINDMLDLDSDNDGITDVVEAGGTDANGDGIIDGYVDTDGDGLSDNVDPNNGGTPLPIPDTDNDGHVNYLDIDADNDGIVDNIEAQTTAGYVPPTGQDTDGDGIDNAYDADNGGTPIVLTNTDGADNPDYLDLDSDNDGMSDLLEGWDTNNDGSADTTPSGNDSDNDGLDDAFDVDGTSTTNAGGSTNGGDLPTDFPDLDNVGGDRDWRDGIDHDNDGIDDIVDLDDDNDGIPDTFEASGDTDGDGIPDSLDLDSDNDGIADIIEAGGTDANGDGLVDNFVDTNNDGLDDNIAANPIGNPDSDGDGIPNTTDLDSDNDGILDVIEAGGTDANGDGLLDNYVDTDGDGWNDNADPNAGGTLLPTPDTDSDGNMNFLDIDADNDGIVDNVEGQSTGGYTPPTGTDTDGDGIDDAYDIDNGGTPINPVNTDGTDNPDYLDLDSDNDGDIDAVEAWDTNNDGDPEITPTGNDSDGDGLDDAYDIDGTSTTNNGGATNGGTTPNSFPDLDNPGGDRDWREIIGTELEIPTGFSPNGDGVNDFFEIVGIGSYPDNTVTIFNRWGNLVYEAAGYDNGAVRWNGENTGNLSVGNGPVPEGTYFYVIDLGDGSAVISGYVFLNRQ